MINEDKLFAILRSMDEDKKLDQRQVDSVHALLQECEANGVIDKRQIAYVLATCFHEARLKPVEEGGKGAGRDYGKKLKMGGGPGKRVPYTTPDKLYYGRGLTQITWFENYAQFSKLLHVDLLNHPEFALQTDYAAKIAVIGMRDGLFTGAKLNRFFNNKVTDPLNARLIINGKDKASLIKGYYDLILKSL